MTQIHTGFVALAGRPNVGKSTLLNALVGQKLSIVTQRPQTTRHRILGLLQRPDAQIAFVDTPGMHRGEKRALNRSMNRSATGATADADLALFVVEALRWTDEDAMALERIRQTGRPIITVINKVDLAKPKTRLLPYLEELSSVHKLDPMVPVSARRGSQLDHLVQTITAALPLGEPMFPLDQLTDRSDNFRIAEIIREKLTMELVQELPYGIAVEVERVEPTADGRKEVAAVIWVDREGQKPIVIGADGSRLKRVGRAARMEINHVLGGRYHLELWVKVRENWADDARALQQLGME